MFISDSWVPREAAVAGLSFFTARLPNTPHTILHDFLRSMNRVWQRREKRKLNRVKKAYITKIQELQRKLSNAKPYRGVIAEQRIRMLKSQVDREREKHLHGRPLLKDADDDYAEDVADVAHAPQEQLLHASLSTLETIGRHSLAHSHDHSYKHTGKTGGYPSELYLHGATWLGRNFLMVSEEMAETMEHFRAKALRELTGCFISVSLSLLKP